MEPIRATAIIPFRNRHDRLRLLRFVAAWADRRFQQVIIAEEPDSPAPFCKSKLLNAATDQAETPLLCLLDADAICSDADLAQAASIASKVRTIVYPFQYIWRLGPTSTEQVLQENPVTIQIARLVENWQPPERRLTSPGTILFVPKETYLRVGGMDEGYFEWGAEDNDFRDRVRSAVGYERRIRSWVYHLYHTPNPTRPKENLDRYKGIIP